jgi:hypothetical protein
MTDATFTKLDASPKPLFGPRRLVMCGFDESARKDFEKLIRVAEIEGLDCLWAGAAEGSLELKILFERSLDASANPGHALNETIHPRAVIAGGLTQKEFHLLMNLSREVGMPPTLWAVLTPTSETWPLDALLKELSAERAAMAARRRKTSP